MKEKISLLIALSFLVGLTAYKKTFDSVSEFSTDIPIKLEENNIENVDIQLESNTNSNYAICESNELDTDKLQFNEAFKYYRNCAHDTFIWNGVEYTTILKSEINDNKNEKHESLNDKMDLVSK